MGHAAACTALCGLLTLCLFTVVLNGNNNNLGGLSRSDLVIEPRVAKNVTSWTVLMVDSRRLESNISAASYPSFAAVANADYAARHGYRFIYAVPLELNRSFLAAEKVATAAGASVSCYHPLLRAARAPNWARLPILWHLLTAHDDARVLYIDSDLILVGNDSIPEFLQKPHLSGPSPATAPLSMLTNIPWGSTRACSGLVAAQHSTGAADLIRDWWDINAPYFNTHNVFEQSALWNQIYPETPRSSSRPVRLNDSVISVVDERAFLDDSHESLPVSQREHRFARHWSKSLVRNHTDVMRHALYRMGYSSASFTRKIRALQADGREQLYNTIPISDRMARITTAERCRVEKVC